MTQKINLIGMEVETRNRLDKLKIIPRESYNAVVIRLLNNNEKKMFKEKIKIEEVLAH